MEVGRRPYEHIYKVYNLQLGSFTVGGVQWKNVSGDCFKQI